MVSQLLSRLKLEIAGIVLKPYAAFFVFSFQQILATTISSFPLGDY